MSLLTMMDHVPTDDWKNWFQHAMKHNMQEYLNANVHRFANKRLLPWSAMQTLIPDVVRAYHFKHAFFDCSDNKSRYKIKIYILSQGFFGRYLSSYLSTFQPPDPGAFWHVY